MRRRENYDEMYKIDYINVPTTSTLEWGMGKKSSTEKNREGAF